MLPYIQHLLTLSRIGSNQNLILGKFQPPGTLWKHLPQVPWGPAGAAVVSDKEGRRWNTRMARGRGDTTPGKWENTTTDFDKNIFCFTKSLETTWSLELKLIANGRKFPDNNQKTGRKKRPASSLGIALSPFFLNISEEASWLFNSQWSLTNLSWNNCLVKCAVVSYKQLWFLYIYIFFFFIILGFIYLHIS